jgi:hypothetical protein
MRSSGRGESGVQRGGKLATAGYTLVGEAGEDVAVAYDRFSAPKALQDAVRALEMLVAIRGEKAREGSGLALTLPGEDAPNKPALGHVRRLAGRPPGDPRARERFTYESQLGRRSGPVAALEHDEAAKRHSR